MSKALVRPLPRTWWLKKGAYLRFMIRELTSLAVFAYALVLIGALWSAGDDSAFSSFYNFLTGPWSVVLHGLVLALALYHTVTWIALTPKVMVLVRDDEPVDPGLVAAATAVLFLVVTGGLVWLTLG